jgi:hypothetical protein
MRVNLGEFKHEGTEPAKVDAFAMNSAGVLA